MLGEMANRRAGPAQRVMNSGVGESERNGIGGARQAMNAAQANARRGGVAVCVLTRANVQCIAEGITCEAGSAACSVRVCR